MKSLSAFGLVLSLVACGGKADDLTDSGPPDSGHDSSSPDVDVIDAQPPLSPLCPTSQPSDGTACTHDGIKCEYGSDPRYVCDWIASCDQGLWTLTMANSMYCPWTTNPQACPATFAEAQQGGACSADGTPCQYAEGWCSCIGGPPATPDAGAPQVYWMCQGSPSVACPAKRPHLGTTCTQPDLECDYSPCGYPEGLTVRCDGTYDTWVDDVAVCGGAKGT